MLEDSWEHSWNALDQAIETHFKEFLKTWFRLFEDFLKTMSKHLNITSNTTSKMTTLWSTHLKQKLWLITTPRLYKTASRRCKDYFDIKYDFKTTQINCSQLGITQPIFFLITNLIAKLSQAPAPAQLTGLASLNFTYSSNPPPPPPTRESLFLSFI